MAASQYGVMVSLFSVRLKTNTFINVTTINLFSDSYIIVISAVNAFYIRHTTHIISMPLSGFHFYLAKTTACGTVTEQCHSKCIAVK